MKIFIKAMNIILQVLLKVSLWIIDRRSGGFADAGIRGKVDRFVGSFVDRALFLADRFMIVLLRLIIELVAVVKFSFDIAKG